MFLLKCVTTSQYKFKIFKLSQLFYIFFYLRNTNNNLCTALKQSIYFNISSDKMRHDSGQVSRQRRPVRVQRPRGRDRVQPVAVDGLARILRGSGVRQVAAQVRGLDHQQETRSHGCPLCNYDWQRVRNFVLILNLLFSLLWDVSFVYEASMSYILFTESGAS